MPIPMRTPSLREPRKQSSVPTARTTTLKSTTTTTTTTTTAPSTASSNPPTANENAATRNKTLLPVRDEVRSASSRLQQAQDSRLPQRGGLRPPQKISGQHDPAPLSGSSTVARRQSLIRPSPLKTTSTSTAKSTTTASTTSKWNAVAGPPSPVKSSLPAKENTRPISPKKTDMRPPAASSVKSSLPSRENGRPTSPKKTDMPPPPRPVRSASLRQPVRSSPGTTVSAPRGHTRHRSQVAPPGSTSTTKKTEPPSPVVPSTPRRGQFSTYQQHYSPKKTAPSSTATLSGPPADLDPSLIPSSWPEIAALQTELLQLSLLHSSSQQQHVSWQSDAEAELRSLYETVASDYRDVLAEERARQRQLNGQALQGWVDNCQEHRGHQGFAEQIQVLSQVMQELCDLTDSPGGRYMSLVQGFESWFHHAEEIRSYRRLYPEEEADGAMFIDPLDSAWKQEVYTLTMTLELFLRQLQSLDILGYGTVEPLEGSTLLRTATGLNEMGSLMVEELQTMRKIEADIVAGERAWVSQLAGQLAATASRPGIPARAPRVGMWSPLSVKS